MIGYCCIADIRAYPTLPFELVLTVLTLLTELGYSRRFRQFAPISVLVGLTEPIVSIFVRSVRTVRTTSTRRVGESLYSCNTDIRASGTRALPTRERGSAVDAGRRAADAQRRISMIHTKPGHEGHACLPYSSRLSRYSIRLGLTDLGDRSSK